MISKQFVEYSKDSSASALGSVLEDALAYIGHSHGAHVFVDGLIKTSGGWKAIVEVVLEEEPEEDILSSKPAPAYKREKQNLKKRLDYIYEQEQLLLKKHNHELFEKLQEEEAALKKELDELTEKRVREKMSHVYLMPTQAEIFFSLKDRPQFTYVHIIPEGSLWDAAKKYHPDLELHAAAQNTKSADIDPPKLNHAQLNTPKNNREDELSRDLEE